MDAKTQSSSPPEKCPVCGRQRAYVSDIGDVFYACGASWINGRMFVQCPGVERALEMLRADVAALSSQVEYMRAQLNAKRQRRQTGRTTRMMEEAMRLAEKGRAVYVIAADQRHVITLRQQFRLAESLGVKFETPAHVNFDFFEMRLPGAHPNCAVLVDHYTIERMFSKQLAELHRFDDPAE